MNYEHAEKLYEEMSAMISHVSESMGKCRSHCMNKYNNTVNAVASDILACLEIDPDEENSDMMYDNFAKDITFEEVLMELEVKMDEE